MGEMTAQVKIEYGVRQKCILSSNLFLLVIDWIIINQVTIKHVLYKISLMF